MRRLWELLVDMPRNANQSPGGMIFHALNRGNARDRIFDDDADYAACEFYAHGRSHNLTTGSRE